MSVVMDIEIDSMKRGFNIPITKNAFGSVSERNDGNAFGADGDLGSGIV